MHSINKFNKGLLGHSPGVKAWMLVLITANLIVPLFLLPRVAAMVVIATFFAGFGLMVWITKVSGFSRLLGLGHVLWIPLVAYAWSLLGTPDDSGVYGYWLRALITVNTVSLCWDAIDVLRYLRGNRRPIVSGLE